MSEQSGFVAAVAAAVVDSGNDHDLLMQSIVEVARAIFGARASSMFLLDEPSGDLVFQAVAGEGAGFLLGRRFSATQGIAGWVLTAGEPIIVSDLSKSDAFAREIAESTGYVPRSMMAAPLLIEDRRLGVLEVLDYGTAPAALGAMELLSLFCQQAGIALRIVQRSREARRILQQEGGELAELVSVARALDGLDTDQRAAGLRLLGSFRSLLSPSPPT